MNLARHSNLRKSITAVVLGIPVCMGLSAVVAAAPPPALEFKIESFSDVPEAPVLCVPRVSKPPVLDGKLNDDAWTHAAIIKRLGATNGGESDLRTTVRVVYDDANLYVAFDCDEPHMDLVRVKAQAGEDKWPGDAVEVFLDAGLTRQHYYQFVTNSRDAHNDYRDGVIKWNGKWKCKAGLASTGWVTEIAIPWDDLNLKAAPDDQTWGFNVTRERSVAAQEDSEGSGNLSTWMPMQRFSSPSLFGPLYFGTREKYAGTFHPTQLQGTLDKRVYTKHQPLAHLALEITGGETRDAKLTLQVGRRVGTEVLLNSVLPLPSTRIGVDVPIASLEPGEYRLAAQVTDKQGRGSNSLGIEFDLRAARPVADSGEIAIRQTQTIKNSIERWPARTGVPFPEGVLWKPDQVELISPDGKSVPVQTQTLSTWSKGGSIQWLGLDFQLSLKPEPPGSLTLRYGPNVKRAVGGQLRVDQNDRIITVDTGAAKFEIRRQNFNFLDKAWIGDRQIMSTGEERGPFMADENGVLFWACLDPNSQVTVEEQGPLKAVIRAEGAHLNARGGSLGRYVVRLYFFSGLPYFRAQHTFIVAEDTNQTRYSDIGLLLPSAGKDCRFGGVADPVKNHAYLLQKKWDQFVVNDLSANGEKKTIATGAKAEGWVSDGEMAVLVRDFWQNFPKEIEFAPARPAILLHFWPGHGERVWKPEEEIQVDHAYMLPFVHQGKLLDFKVPAAYFTGPLAQEYGFAYPDEKGGWKLHYGEGAKTANGMGVGKTHDMLVLFADAARPDRIAPLMEAFQAGTHFLADPKWNCQTKVLGEVAAYDSEKFPLEEATFSDGFDFLMNWTWDLTHAYGMFNYGDSYHAAKRQTPNLAPSYYRLWAGYHHGRARIPWLLYLRSGDPKYLRWARANAQHLIDVNTCHFATTEATGWGNSNRKIVGGMCDYKGYVPWHTGSRVGDYNNMVDFMQLDYYLTGNRRAVDVMHEMGEALLRFGKAFPSREGAGMLGATLDYYRATWDPRALFLFVNELPKMYARPANEQDPPSVQWAPYLEPWIEYNGDPKAKQFLLQLADTLLDSEKTPSGYQHYGDGRALAEAYRVTGDKKYLLHAWGYYNKGPGLYSQPGDPLHHFVDWLDYSFETQQTLPVMAHLASWPQMPTLDQPDYTAGRGSVKMVGSPDANSITVILPEKTDTDFRVASRFFTRKEAQYELSDPNGKIVQSGIIPRTVDSDRFVVVRARDGLVGDNKLRIFGPDEYLFESLGIYSLKTQRFLVPEANKGNFLITGRFFFPVASDCRAFHLTVRGIREKERIAGLDIISPEDKVLRHISLPNGAPEQVIEVQTPAEFRGRIWSLAALGCPVIKVEGIQPWFAATYEGATLKANIGIASTR